MYTAEEQKDLYALSKKYLTADDAVWAATPAAQAAALRKLLVFHEWRYYVCNDPLLSDYEYDQLYARLQQLEAAHPELVCADSPTQRVSSDLTDTFASVAHLSPMLSLGNSYDLGDLEEFDQQLKRMLNMPLTETITYAVEPKFDGGSIALVYENDLLVRAATRGNGSEGEEITANARVLHSIPLRAPFSKLGIRRVELRGEVVIRKDIFARINEERADAGLTLFANPRNTATGGLRMKDPREVAVRGLEAFVYTLGYAEDTNGQPASDRFATHRESLDALASLGFKVPEDQQERRICHGMHQVMDFIGLWEKRRESYPYEIDGMVIKVNELNLQERAGYTAHHPRWAIAYKFAARQATTTLLHVEYQVGKTGAITPVAKVKTVPLAGVRISSISLHNEDFIREKDLRLGDQVLIERAGDVIPYIVKPLEELRDGSEEPIVWPTFCPVNDTDSPVALLRPQGEAAWRCPRCVCGAQHLQRIIFHVSKNAMDIEGLGKQIVERFFALGWLRNLADVYRLDYDKIATLEGFGQKSAANLQASVEKAKRNPVWRLLHSLSIHQMGQRASKLLAAEIGHVLELATWDEDKFLHIKDIGPTLAQNTMAFFQDPTNMALLREMEALGVNMLPTEDDKPPMQATSGPFLGKSILFTGTLLQMSRKEAQEKAAAAGARNVSAVSSHLDILVVGEKAGSKLKKAQALGSVLILTEEEFLQAIQAI